MRRSSVISAVIILALTLLIWRPWRASFGYHFSFPLPPSATLVNYHHSWGLDQGDEFEFAVTDDALRDAIIREWKLTPAPPDRAPLSAAKFTGAPWWPRDRLNQMSEKYSRVDEAATRYWSLWVDRESGRVYAEYGDW